jgi:hypothetical protein
MQNVIRKQAKARGAVDDRLLGNRSFPRLARRSVVGSSGGSAGNRPAESNCVGSAWNSSAPHFQLA